MNCETVKNSMAEYIGSTLDDSLKVEIEEHLEFCDDCFNEIRAVDKTIWNVEKSSRSIKAVPGFLDGVAENVLKMHNPIINNVRKRLKRIAVPAAISAVVLTVAILIMFLVPQRLKYRMLNAVTFGRVYDTSYGTFGRKLNISSTYDTTKITVTKVSADDIQTIIYFKVYGQEGNRCFLNGPESVDVKEKWPNGPFNSNSFIEYNPYEGGFRLYLSPIDTAKKALHITLKQVISLSNNSGNAISYANVIKGNWSFTIPVEKMDGKSMDVNYKLRLNDGELTVNKVQTGPTGTKVDFNYQRVNSDSLFMGLSDSQLQDGLKMYRITNYTGNDTRFSVIYESAYPHSPEDLNLCINSCYSAVMYTQTKPIIVNLDGPFPLKYDFLGDTIAIDNLKVDQNRITFDLIEPKRKREYTQINIDFQGSFNKFDMTGDEYYIVDEDGVEYKYDDVVKNPDKYRDKHIIYYPVKQSYIIEPKDMTQKQFTLNIMGYTSISRVDKTIPLKQQVE
jgi:hypothetical protein